MTLSLGRETRTLRLWTIAPNLGSTDIDRGSGRELVVRLDLLAVTRFDYPHRAERIADAIRLYLDQQETPQL